MACRSENLSEHYIKAKKFAALRSHKKSDAASTAKKGKKKQPSQATTNLQSDQFTAKGPSPPRQESNSMSEAQKLRFAINHIKRATESYPAGASMEAIQDLSLHQNKFSEPLSAGTALLKK